MVPGLGWLLDVPGAAATSCQEHYRSDGLPPFRQVTSRAQGPHAALPAAWPVGEVPSEGHPNPGARGPLTAGLSNPEGGGEEASFQGRDLELAVALVTLNRLKMHPSFQRHRAAPPSPRAGGGSWVSYGGRCAVCTVF